MRSGQREREKEREKEGEKDKERERERNREEQFVQKPNQYKSLLKRGRGKGKNSPLARAQRQSCQTESFRQTETYKEKRERKREGGESGRENARVQRWGGKETTEGNEHRTPH